MAIIADVVPQQIIQSGWGNSIRDTGVTQFASTTERNSQLAVPQDGRVCFAAAQNQLYVGVDGQWRAVMHDLGNGGGTIGSVRILAAPVVAPQGGRLTLIGSPEWLIENHTSQLHLYTGSRAAAQISISSSAVTIRENTTITGTLTASGRITGSAGVRVDGGTLDVNVHTDATTITATGLVTSSSGFRVGDTYLQSGLVQSTTGPVTLRVPGANYITLEAGTTDLVRMRLAGGKTDINFPTDLPALTQGHLVVITEASKQLGRALAFPVGALLSRLEALEAAVGLESPQLEEEPQLEESAA